MFEFIVWYSILHPSEKEVLSEWISETLYTRHQKLVNFPRMGHYYFHLSNRIYGWVLVIQKG